MSTVPRPTHHPLCICNSLLIPTQGYFSGKRFLCMKCGRLYAQPPLMQLWTPEAEMKQARLGDEFYVNCGNHLIVWGYFRPGCSRCKEPPEQEHIYHSDNRDWQLCFDALKWLSDRTGREFVFVNGDIYHAGTTPPITPEKFMDEILRGKL